MKPTSEMSDLEVVLHAAEQRFNQIGTEFAFGQRLEKAIKHIRCPSGRIAAIVNNRTISIPYEGSADDYTHFCDYCHHGMREDESPHFHDYPSRIKGRTIHVQAPKRKL